MKVKDGFMLREVAGQWIVVPLGDNVVDINGIITLSASAALLWKELENGVENPDALADALLKEYDIDRETALADSKEFIGKLKDKDMIE